MNAIVMQLPAKPMTSYPIMIESGLLSSPQEWLPSNLNHKKLVIITDDTVKELYGNELANKLQAANPLLLTFKPGENSKNISTQQQIIEKMLEQHCNRDTLILALGGGVVGDVAGFVASTYMRGIAYIQIPTTLLAMVDSSVGGKTGINTSHGKNLIGAFWQPSKVVIDLNCLATLPQEQLTNGLIEALKIFITCDRNSFNYSLQHLDLVVKYDEEVIKYIIKQAIQIKVRIVSNDETENHQRMILNFGHTIGHALEKISAYTVLHGYAVALGILVEAQISVLSSLLADSDYQIIKNILQQLGITGSQLQTFDVNAVIAATKNDKKAKESSVRYVLLKKLGEVYCDKQHYVHSIEDSKVKQAFLNVCEDLI